MGGYSGKTLTRTKATPEPTLKHSDISGLEGSAVTENTKLRNRTPQKR